FIAVLVAEDTVSERLAVTGRTAVVDHQRGPAVAGVNLVAEIERRTLLAVRPSVNNHHKRVPGVRGHTCWAREKSFYFPLIVVAEEGERFDRRDGLGCHPIRIQVRQLSRFASSARKQVEFGGVLGGRERVSHRSIGSG